MVLTSNVGTVVLLLLIGQFVLAGVWELKQQSIGIRRYDPRLEFSMYDGFEDKLTFAKEFAEARKMTLHPHYMWKTKPYTGKYVNIDEDGHRKTIKNPDPEAKKVFMLGGSTLWGEGSPDDGTIPSYLQAKLGNGYNVTNMGQTGFTSVQELSYLLDRLTKGDVPDIVIFYDGVNDGFTTVYSPAERRSLHNVEQMLGFKPEPTTLGTALRDVYQGSGYAILPKFLKFLPASTDAQHQGWDEKIAPKVAENVQHTLNDYEELMKQVNALAETYGFEVYHFWQPNLFSDKRPVQGDEEHPLAEASTTWVNSQKDLYKAARKRFSGREANGIFYIGDVLDDMGPTYIDWCHITPEGNARVADAIYVRLKDRLASVAANPALTDVKASIPAADTSNKVAIHSNVDSKNVLSSENPR